MSKLSGTVTDLTIKDIEELVISLGEPAYRVNQLLDGVYRRLAVSYDEMTDLSLVLRQKLEKRIALHTLSLVREVVSRDGTVKVLFRLADGKTIESALMLYAAGAGRPRTTVCLSTQVGCPISCLFCATGQQGFERNLTPGEIIDQVLYFARRVRDSSEESRHSHITNIVFMGMGEPLANYEALMQTIVALTSPRCFGTSPRNITISTAGLVPQIRQLGREKVKVGLAVSLHAPDNTLRSRLVPLNKRYPLEELIPACREYAEKTGRRVSFEYVLFTGINDSLSQAGALAKLLVGINCHVNLIPANRTADKAFQPPSRTRVLAFEQQLKLAGINCTLRLSRGQDIDAGCGQLRSSLLRHEIQIRK
ncbi:MAG TPA: 23S rRNA (adenine(2503)-C(2))-methyltransferase RlmN [Dehalococcoidales bacterium]